jgi:GAF domain-containing protein
MIDPSGSAMESAAARSFDAEVSAAMSIPTRTVLPPMVSPRYYPDSALESIEKFRGLLLSHSSVETLLQGLCERVATVVPGADMVGVTLLHSRSRGPTTIACTDSRIVAIESDQDLTDEGPGLEAARTNRIVCVRVGDAWTRWPDFASKAADVGVRSYLSAPLAVDSEHAGSLNLYGFGEHGFNDIDEVLVMMFVTAAQTAVFNSRLLAEALAETEGLRTAMLTRSTIDQAKGILMAVRAISADAAFAALSEQSQRENTRVKDLAARIVDTVVDGHRKVR